MTGKVTHLTEILKKDSPHILVFTPFYHYLIGQGWERQPCAGLCRQAHSGGGDHRKPPHADAMPQSTSRL
ncbi:MAG: hypothetical protein QM534_15960 [Sediminibacterium sp.]|nr:hypothetical protein [Sediminibacterium sp.]